MHTGVQHYRWPQTDKHATANGPSRLAAGTVARYPSRIPCPLLQPPVPAASTDEVGWRVADVPQARQPCQPRPLTHQFTAGREVTLHSSRPQALREAADVLIRSAAAFDLGPPRSDWQPRSSKGPFGLLELAPNSDLGLQPPLDCGISWPWSPGLSNSSTLAAPKSETYSPGTSTASIRERPPNGLGRPSPLDLFCRPHGTDQLWRTAGTITLAQQQAEGEEARGKQKQVQTCGLDKLLEDAETVCQELQAKRSLPAAREGDTHAQARARELAYACTALGRELGKLDVHLRWADRRLTASGTEFAKLATAKSGYERPCEAVTAQRFNVPFPGDFQPHSPPTLDKGWTPSLLHG
ncbi:unnamed protein product [Polarella glacialis]|uniref:Uncharacterized protein n=1 Tax=Polarella glacialis TaxID=89957 RepID=A0A813KK03_POLGL|nr:unnamed protein product [Polarella glacialis]